MKKVKSKYGFTYSGVSLDPVSQTVPDQSLSVEEILRRFTTGTMLADEIIRNHQYGEDIAPDENEDYIRPEYDPDFDISDAYQLAQSAESLRADLQRPPKLQEVQSATAVPSSNPPSVSNGSSEGA